MDKQGNTSKIRTTLSNIYSDFRSRIDADLWKKGIEDCITETGENLSVPVTDFMLEHKYVPVKVWRTVFSMIGFRNHPVRMANLYNENVVCDILKKMSGNDTFRYAYIAPSFQEETIRFLMDTAEAAEHYLDLGQLYLAEKAIESIRKYCPTHPDLLQLQKRFAEVRSTGGVSMERNQAAFEKKKAPVIEIPDDEGQLDALIIKYEKAIEADFHSYGNYYPLGLLYLEKEDVQKADWMASMLMDLGEYLSAAYLLKGKVLESKQQMEDAFFYYQLSVREDKENAEAAESRKRLLDILQPGYEEASPVQQSEAASVSLTEKESAAVLRIVSDTDLLIRRGRLTEAYFELVKKSEEYKESNLLRFKKALALYLMKKEPEARSLLKKIPKTAPVYHNAANLIMDIDRKIVDYKKYDNVLPGDLADIFFRIGRYEDALKIYRKMQESDLTPEMLVQKGKCELEIGLLNAAQQSLANAMNKNYNVPQACELTGLILQAKGKNKQALELYEEALRREPENVSICEFKAFLLYEMEKYEALLEFRNQLENRGFPASDVDGYAGLIQILGYPRNEERGLRNLERAIYAGSSNIEFYIVAVNFCISHGQYFRAMLYTELGLTACGNSDELYMKKSELLYRSGALTAAQSNAERLLAKKPDSAEIQFLLGCIFSEKGEDKEGLRWFRSAAELDGTNHKYAYAAADKCFEIDDMTSALNFYSKAIQLDPDDYVSLKRRALIYSLRGENKKAENDIRNALLLKHDDPEIYLIIGDILSGGGVWTEIDLQQEMERENGSGEKPEERKGEFLAAISPDGELSAERNARPKVKDAAYYYGKALSMDPSYRQGYISRAHYYTDCKRLDEAMEDIERAVQLDPEAGDAYMMRGIVRLVREEFEEAIKDFQKAEKSKAFRVQAYSYIAKCRNALHQYDLAVETADKGIAIDSEFLNLYLNRGIAYYYLEKNYQAIEDFKRVIQKKNEITTSAVETVYRYRGMTYERIENIESALNDYRMLMKYNPDDSEIRSRIAELESQVEVTRKKNFFSFFSRRKKRGED